MTNLKKILDIFELSVYYSCKGHRAIVFDCLCKRKETMMAKNEKRAVKQITEAPSSGINIPIVRLTSSQAPVVCKRTLSDLTLSPIRHNRLDKSQVSKFKNH